MFDEKPIFITRFGFEILHIERERDRERRNKRKRERVETKERKRERIFPLKPLSLSKGDRRHW